MYTPICDSQDGAGGLIRGLQANLLFLESRLDIGEFNLISGLSVLSEAASFVQKALPVPFCSRGLCSSGAIGLDCVLVAYHVT